jgi:ABC-type Fe3+-siderophore transport system permease subunit
MQLNADKVMRLVALGTACVCMLLIVGGLLIFVLRNPNSPQISSVLGKSSGAGFIGVLFIFYRTVLAALKSTSTKGGK